MKYKLPKKKDRTKNKYWFAWRPVVARDRDDNRYLIWLVDVWRASTMGLISYHIT